MTALAAFRQTWSPGDAITSTTPLRPLLSTIGFGLNDLASFQSIADKLALRNIETVGALFSNTQYEIKAMIGVLELKKAPLSYIAAISAAAGINFAAAPIGQPNKCGGDFNSKCIKANASVNKFYSLLPAQAATRRTPSQTSPCTRATQPTRAASCSRTCSPTTSTPSSTPTPAA